MSTTTAPALFEHCRTRIDALLEGHADMGVVERTIDAAHALDRDEKDALWLWASGRRDHRPVTQPMRQP